MSDEPRTFSQTDLDRIIETRLARAEATYEGRHSEALKVERDRADELAQKLAAATERANEIAIDAEIKLGASERNFIDPADALRLVDKTRLGVSEDGSVTGVVEELDGLAYRSPHLIERPSSSSIDQGARGGVRRFSREDLKSMSAQEIVDAQDRGLLDHILKGGA
jgi:hypothetical protein